MKYNFTIGIEDIIIKILSSCLNINIKVYELKDLFKFDEEDNLTILKFSSKKNTYYFGVIENYFKKDYEYIKDNDLNEIEDNLIKKIRNNLI